MSRNKIQPATDRRQLLKLLGGGVAAGLGLPLGCSRSDPPTITRLPLATVPVGGRVRVLDGENPVELRRKDDGSVLARSLWCTHFGCEVSWSQDRRQYLCPCHDGVYGDDGRPISGPPVRPLATLLVSVAGNEILLGVAPGEAGS